MSAIGFTAKLEGTRSHLYDGGSPIVASYGKVKADASNCTSYVPQAMDQFRVWHTGWGKKVLMEKDPSTSYSYWEARKVLP